MMRAIVAAAFVVGVATASPPPAAAQSQDRARRLLEAASARYSATTSLCADFVQRISIPLLREEKEGRGRLCQARPDRFAMRFTDPEGDAVVVDGSSVWVYYPSLDPKQVFQLPLAVGTGGLDLHREFLQDPATRYSATFRGTETIGGREVYVVHLVPREAASYRSATVWIEPVSSVLLRILVEEENGNLRSVTLSNVEVDLTVPEGWFAFTPPAGAQVIRR